MTNANELFARDERIHRECGFSPFAFVNPNVPDPITPEERAARRILAGQLEGRQISPNQIVMLHIYDVLEAMEKAWRHGANEAKECD